MIKRKRLILLFFLTILFIGLFLFFFKNKNQTGNIRIEIKDNNLIPYDIGQTSLIESPEEGTWVNGDFEIKTFDEVVGNSDLALASCWYETCAYSQDREEFCTNKISRKCNSERVITAGPGTMMCRFEGEKACRIYSSNEISGNKAEGSIYVNVDWTPPSIENLQVSTSSNGYLLKTIAKDNTAISRCGLYLNDKFEKMMEISPLNCAKECNVSTTISIPNSQTYSLYVRCDDLSRNFVNSNQIEIKSNTPPKIINCKAMQTSVNRQINFSVETEDADNDLLSYSWDFGDNSKSQQQNAVYTYTKAGVYEPKVIVSDGEKQDECFTAWVSIK